MGRPAIALVADAPNITVGMPAEFASLAQDRHAIVDIFFGGLSIGQFEVETGSGRLTILNPDLVVAAIPGVRDAPALTAALTGALDTHAGMVCSDPNIPCDRPKPSQAAIVYDEGHFRVDLYVAPHLLDVRPAMADRYLKPIDGRLSAIDSLAASVAGGDGQPVLYSIRNRLVVGADTARFVSDMSVGSGRGFNLDTAAMQIDRQDVRYSAGLFYAPGADLVGRRRIVGAGVASQTDMRTDRDLINGTPLTVFLTGRSRVDLFVEQRLVSSEVYEAGNQQLDTSSLPDGSYPVEIRIQENSGASRTEQRFFTKSAAIPAAGQTFFFANAGVLAGERSNRPVDIARYPIAMAGVARRMNSHVAWDVTAIGTRSLLLTEAGVNIFAGIGQARAAIMGTTRGDHGAILQLSSAAGERLGFNFDLRRVKSQDNRPIIPLDDYGDNPLLATDAQFQQAQFAGTTFSQAVGTVTYRMGQAQIGLSAYLRRDVGRPASYAVGPAVRWQLLQRNRVQLTFDGSHVFTDRGQSTAFGLRLQILGQRSSLGVSAGAQTVSRRSGQRLGESMEITGSMQRESATLGEVTASGTLQQVGGINLVQATIEDRGPLGYASATVLQRGGDGQNGTQYALNLQTGIAATGNGLHVGSQRQTDSMIMVSVDGSSKDASFEVLLNESPIGTVRSGRRMVIPLFPYRRYTVRIRPTGGDLVNYDNRPRVIDLFPGSVADLRWKVDWVAAMFGRLIGPDGAPIVNADIVAPGAISASDDHGYFQLQSARDATIVVRQGGGAPCSVTLNAMQSDEAYTALGDVTCRP